ncbi:hypothetical protein Tco_0454179 [Tanacetum coccineum]
MTASLQRSNCSDHFIHHFIESCVGYSTQMILHSERNFWKNPLVAGTAGAGIVTLLECRGMWKAFRSITIWILVSMYRK